MKVLLVSAPSGLIPFVREYDVDDAQAIRIWIAQTAERDFREVATAVFNLSGPDAARQVLRAGRRT